MTNSAGPPGKRQLPRSESTGAIHLTFGLDALYYFLNGEREFSAADAGGAGGPSYAVEQWRLANQGPGGFAVASRDRPEAVIRVGDLVGINTGGPGEDGVMKWSLGVIRWLMISRDDSYRMGIETIAADILPGAIRPTAGSGTDAYHRALIAGEIDAGGSSSIVTRQGLFETNRELEISTGARRLPCRAVSLIESSVNYEYFTVRCRN